MSARTTYAHVIDPNRNWYNNKRIIILNFWILLLLITSSTTTYETDIVSSFHSLPQWTRYFNPGGRIKIKLLNNIQTLGSLAALPFIPLVADGLGRRACIFIGASIICVATALQTGATFLDLFIGARFFIGFGIAFATTAAPILVAEIAYPTHRAPLTSAYGSLWYLGTIIATWGTFGAAKMQTTWSWRLPSILQLIPSVFLMALIWFVPESPRWLVSKNRNAQALQTLAYYHADSNEDDPLVRFEFDKIKTAIDREVAAKLGCWKTLFAGLTSLKRVNLLLILAFAWPWYSYPFVKVLTTAGITNPDTHLLLNGVFQLWNFFWTLLAASLVDRVGRRTLILTSMGGVIVFFSLQTACSTYYAQTHHQAAAYAFLTSIFLFYGFSSLAFPTLLISYPIEIFPYSLRAKGFTIYNVCVCLASFFSLNVSLPMGLGPFQWNIVYLLVIIVQAICFWIFIIETKNRTLEETGIVFGGNETILTRINTRSSGEKRLSKRLSTYQEYNVASASDKPVDVESVVAEIFVL